MKRFPLFCVALAVISTTLQPPRQIQAAVVKDVTFADTISIGGRECRLNGVGLRRKLIIDVYLGALYLATPSRDAASVIAADEPKQVMMHFLHSKVGAEQIREAWSDGFKANSPAEAEKQADNVRRFLALFDEDMRRGESLTMTYIPGTGTEVSVKGKVKGAVAGADFMKLLFSVWFGPKPVDKNLSSGMLGNR